MQRGANAPRTERVESRAGRLRSFALAFLVHGLLFAFLYLGIRWQSRPPAAIEAELWSEPPRAAAPAPEVPQQPAPQPPKPVIREEPRPEPEPAPRKPDIVEKVEKRKPDAQKKEEKPRVEARREESVRDDPVKAAAEKEMMLREAANKAARELASLKSSNAEAVANQRRLEGWADQVRSLIRKDVKAAIADAVAGNPEAVFEVKLLPGPRVGAVRKLKSSGNLAYDEAAQKAIEANERLPAPPAGVTLDPVLVLRMRPKDE
jgi:colicin import membrane protein